MKKLVLTILAAVLATFAVTQTSGDMSLFSRAVADLRYTKVSVPRTAGMLGVGVARAALQDTTTSLSIQVVGDSTGNDTNEWVYLFAQYLAARNPAFTVRHFLWNDGDPALGTPTYGDYDAPTTLYTAAGGERYAYTGNGAGVNHKFYLPDSAIEHQSGDIDVRVKLLPDSGLWTSARRTTVTEPSGTYTAGSQVNVDSTTGFSVGNTVYLGTTGATAVIASIVDATTVTFSHDETVAEGENMDMDGAVILSHYAGSPNFGWSFSLRHTAGLIGRLNLGYSVDGLAFSSVNSTASVSLTAGQAGWLRFTRTASNGNVNFYESTNGTSWTPIGAMVDTLDGALFDTNGEYSIATRSNSGNLSGRYYAVEIRSGIDNAGYVVTPRSIDAWLQGGGGATATSFGGSPYLDIWNGSKPGQTIAAATASTHPKAPNPNVSYYKRLMTTSKPVVVFASLGHNQTNEVEAVWNASLDSLKAKLDERYPYAQQVYLTQNPQLTGAAYARHHNGPRRRELIAWTRRNSVGCIDVQGVFYGSGLALTSLVHQENPPGTPDRVHPTTVGSVLWRDAVIAAYEGGF